MMTDKLVKEFSDRLNLYAQVHRVAELMKQEVAQQKAQKSSTK